ncbi:histidine kinase [Halopseudomonas sp.]|uniref:histidine kinase n=1 Tax=Halopseudomonas sp. TaxID=2901191 RepID=UPI00356B1A2B
MNQTPPASENLFLRCYAAWRAQSMKLTGKLLLLALLPLVAILLLLGVAKFQLHADVAEQADAIGDELARQVAASVAEPLAADDQLSLNIQLAQWNRSPLIGHVRLFTAENRLIAEAGNEPARGKLAPGQGQFNAVVHFQETMVGQVQLHLAAQPLLGPSNSLLWRLFWGALILALLAGLAAWRLGSDMRRTLEALGHWYGDSGQPAPGASRRDELGGLSRSLEKRRIVDMPPEPEPEPEPEEQSRTADQSSAESTEDEPQGTTVRPASLQPATTDDKPGKAADSADDIAAEEQSLEEIQPVDAAVAESPSEEVLQPAIAPAETAVLAVRLGNQEALRRLARPRLMLVLERYRTQLERACELYDGHLHTLHDGTSVIAFHARECRQDELTHALCCGELLRVLGHELQVEIADTGITLHLQLAIGHCADLRPVPDAELAARPECQSVLDVVQHSRNLLLLDAALADSAALRERGVVRRLASQPGIYCIERLHGPYQAMLEQQLTHFYHQRPD